MTLAVLAPVAAAGEAVVEDAAVIGAVRAQRAFVVMKKQWKAVRVGAGKPEDVCQASHDGLVSVEVLEVDLG